MAAAVHETHMHRRSFGLVADLNSFVRQVKTCGCGKRGAAGQALSLKSDLCDIGAAPTQGDMSAALHSTPCGLEPCATIPS